MKKSQADIQKKKKKNGRKRGAYVFLRSFSTRMKALDYIFNLRAPLPAVWIPLSKYLV